MKSNSRMEAFFEEGQLERKGEKVKRRSDNNPE
jgi:hypothetical protein